MEKVILFQSHTRKFKIPFAVVCSVLPPVARPEQYVFVSVPLTDHRHHVTFDTLVSLAADQ